MMNITQQQEKKVLFAVLAVLAALIIYRIATVEKPKTAPLAFPPGAVSRSAVRQGLTTVSSDAASLSVFLARRAERFPGVLRDIFRMENPAPKTRPAPVIPAPPPPPVLQQRTPEDIAADLSRAELARFRFLGYLTEKDSTLFLSKDGELFIVKSGEKFHKNYQLKQATRDSVLLLDTVTRIERRVDLSGDEAQQPPQLQQQRPPQQVQQPAAQQVQQQSAQQLQRQQQVQQPAAQQVQQQPAQQLQRQQQVQQQMQQQAQQQMQKQMQPQTQQPQEEQSAQPAKRWMERLRNPPMPQETE